MAKSLGQIHNVNSTIGGLITPGVKYNIDLPGQLTSQLQRMVRAGTFHKLVGLDITVDPSSITPGNGVQVSGKIRYMVPTRGRCEAFRSAFRSVAEAMKTQGVTMRDNEYYDFKAPLNNSTTLNTFENNATLDGTTPLALVSSVAGASIFGVHNANVQPIGTATSRPLFSSGFDTLLQGSGGTDFVLNDTQPYSGNHLFASEEYEEIDFQCAFNPAAIANTSDTQVFSWRPDPALYIAIMCGQMQVVFDEVNFTGPTAPGSLNLNVSCQIAGWKSIMGNPDKKPRRRSKKTTSKKKE